LEDFYSRFEINFDEWDGESAYVKEGADLVDELIAQGKCQRSNDNWIVENTIGPGKDKIALRHGNGANLYLNRYSTRKAI
jgi:arginyl-tRNA synthetase